MAADRQIYVLNGPPGVQVENGVVVQGVTFEPGIFRKRKKNLSTLSTFRSL